MESPGRYIVECPGEYIVEGPGEGGGEEGYERYYHRKISNPMFCIFSMCSTILDGKGRKGIRGESKLNIEGRGGEGRGIIESRRVGS